MSEEGFTAAQAILVAKAAGLDVRDLERQTEESESANALPDRVKELEAQLVALTEKQRQQPSLAEQQLAQGRRMVDAMQRQKVGPYGWIGEQDGPAAD